MRDSGYDKNRRLKLWVSVSHPKLLKEWRDSKFFGSMPLWDWLLNNHESVLADYKEAIE